MRKISGKWSETVSRMPDRMNINKKIKKLLTRTLGEAVALPY